MTTYHIHIKGLVQGVGFRPHVYRMAKNMGVKGWVNNTSNGVHIVATADEEILKKFYDKVIQHSPLHAKIVYHHATLMAPQPFDDFYIQHSDHDMQPDLLIPPDFGLCDDCKKELLDTDNRRYRYPFITCTQCGPRYSIIRSLPYDREATTMAPYDQCWQCTEEFQNPGNRRYFSQTNSCNDCGIPMYLYNAEGECICEEYECILLMVQEALGQGHTVAVKGIGGYLLLCDATNQLAIGALRENKHRPSKPLALLYPDIETVERDVQLVPKEKSLLQSVTAPIVLCSLKEVGGSGICTDVIAPKLNKVGIMLPYSPLLALIATKFKKPLIATSGNISGSPIIYTDTDALDELTGIADFFLTYEREIVAPQDDSVIQFSKACQQKIILRRSRGLAPNYFSSPFKNDINILAMGAELKSSFALLDDRHCYVSQYLGDQSNYESQQSFAQTLRHLTGLVKFGPELVLVDSHPDYFVTRAGKELAEKHHLPIYEVQHHRAHFAAVMAENNLFKGPDKILGVVWDGTGYGDDKNIWGGEFFIYEDGKMERTAHLNYFPVTSGDKMAKEPRLSALSLCKGLAGTPVLVKEKFSVQEWNFYQQLVVKNDLIQTSSMGRFLDGIAALLDVCNRSSYEGEAAMQFEALADTCSAKTKEYYILSYDEKVIHWEKMIQEILFDISEKMEKNLIAYKVHLSLVKLVEQIASRLGIKKIAFSGGVMQNALLVDLLTDELKAYELFFHRQLSPNDECISFGQLAYWQLQDQSKPVSVPREIEMLT